MIPQSPYDLGCGHKQADSGVFFFLRNILPTLSRFIWRHCLPNRAFYDIVGLTVQDELRWNKHNFCLPSLGAKKLVLLFSAWNFLSFQFPYSSYFWRQEIRLLNFNVYSESMCNNRLLDVTNNRITDNYRERIFWDNSGVSCLFLV